jgi:hypothetical protein
VDGTPSPPEQIKQYCNLKGYDWQAFRLLLMQLARFVPCPLCGEVHELRIHAMLRRKVRSAEEGENRAILIVAIICGRAEQAGKQYTKRILPPFVIPYCQIGREGVLAYLARLPDGEIVYRLGNELLGARDIRTIRRHIAMGLATIAAAGLELARLLSELPAYADLPEPQISRSSGQYLQELSHQMDRAARRAGARQGPETPPIVYAHLLSVLQRSPGPVAIPLSRVLKAAVFHDSS